MSFQSDKFQAKRSDRDWFATSPNTSTNFAEDSTENLNLHSGLKSSALSESVLLEGCSVRGAFETKGNFRLDGFIEGDVVVEGIITIGESAVVRANIRARTAIVFGKVVGDILCSDKIELQAGAQVRGNIKTRKLLIQDGVVFDGRCEMATGEPDGIISEKMFKDF